METAALIGLLLLISFCLFTKVRQARQWKLDIATDFEAALASMQISTYDLLVSRSKAPTRQQPPEVYRILRDEHGRYFLYLHSGVSPGIFQPLTEDRALLAARMNGQLRPHLLRPEQLHRQRIGHGDCLPGCQRCGSYKYAGKAIGTSGIALSRKSLQASELWTKPIIADQKQTRACISFRPQTLDFIWCPKPESNRHALTSGGF